MMTSKKRRSRGAGPYRKRTHPKNKTVAHRAGAHAPALGLMRFLDHLDEVVYVLRPEGESLLSARVEQVNDAARRVTGYSRSEFQADWAAGF